MRDRRPRDRERAGAVRADEEHVGLRVPAVDGEDRDLEDGRRGSRPGRRCRDLVERVDADERAPRLARDRAITPERRRRRASASAWSRTTAPSPCASTAGERRRARAIAAVPAGSQSLGVDVPADVAVAGGRQRRQDARVVRARRRTGSGTTAAGRRRSRRGSPGRPRRCPRPARRR